MNVNDFLGDVNSNNGGYESSTTGGSHGYSKTEIYWKTHTGDGDH